MARAEFSLAIAVLLLVAVAGPALVEARKHKSTKSAQSSSCSASSLTGYTSSVDLNGNGLLLHWKLTGSSLAAAIEAKPGSGGESGYVSVGWSKGGKMNGDAVVAVKGGKVTGYSLGGTSKSSIKKSGISLGSTSVKATSSGGLLAKFTRIDDGSVPVNLSGSNSIIYAYSSRAKFDNHGGNRGSKSVDFSCIGG
eukprot:TRINITY_DN18756_c0_g1_i2.p1 TRINITY_DN18756_c0_g1~~TRINITY_DN18756_c0_g1_i2.p1  ORF type:complete len:195 (+),score=11.59 TRINITY_DN18756_c0_g1_i2:222-806(+)